MGQHSPSQRGRAFADVIPEGRPCRPGPPAARARSLALERRFPEYNFDRRTVYIEPPLQTEDLENCLALHGLGDHDLIREFYTYFHGVRSYGPLYAGNFDRPEEWTSLRDLGWDENEFCEEYRTTSKEWLDALILYTTSTGDMVIRNAEDQTAWAFAMAENRGHAVCAFIRGLPGSLHQILQLGFFVSITISRMRLPDGPRITSPEWPRLPNAAMPQPVGWVERCFAS